MMGVLHIVLCRPWEWGMLRNHAHTHWHSLSRQIHGVMEPRGERLTGKSDGPLRLRTGLLKCSCHQHSVACITAFSSLGNPEETRDHAEDSSWLRGDFSFPLFLFILSSSASPPPVTGSLLSSLFLATKGGFFLHAQAAIESNTLGDNVSTGAGRDGMKNK